jgi:hypothetical protein
VLSVRNLWISSCRRRLSLPEVLFISKWMALTFAVANKSGCALVVMDRPKMTIWMMPKTWLIASFDPNGFGEEISMKIVTHRIPIQQLFLGLFFHGFRQSALSRDLPSSSSQLSPHRLTKYSWIRSSTAQVLFSGQTNITAARTKERSHLHDVPFVINSRSPPILFQLSFSIQLENLDSFTR